MYEIFYEDKDGYTGCKVVETIHQVREFLYALEGNGELISIKNTKIK